MAEGLRERKKAQTRKAIADVAKALFEEHGFNKVTVAEIAAAANVSPKTVFTYFSTKEDLVFGQEHKLRDEILAGIAQRRTGQSAMEAVQQLLVRLSAKAEVGEVLASLDGFARTVAEAPAVEARLRLMWERYEHALAELLAQETGVLAHEPAPRIVAAQLIAVFRLIGSEATRAYIRALPAKKRKQAMDAWFTAVFQSIGGGIRDYARR